MNILETSASVSELTVAELDLVSGGHDKTTIESKCEIDSNGNGTCTFKSD